MLAPKLRFKEFNDEWKKVKINKILKIKHGKNQKEIECINGKYPILGTGGIIGTTNTPAYLKESVLIGRKGTIDKPMYINIPFWTVDTLFYSDVSSKYNVKFIYYLFNTINWKKYDESTGVPSLSANTIENIDVNISLEKEEQLKISQFLSLVDKKIELQQRKIEVLKMYKKGLTKKLLDYSNYKKVKLKDICTFYSGGTPDSKNKNFYTGNIPFIRSGEIHNETTELYITSEAIKNSSAKMVYKGAVLYALYGATSGDVSISKINGAINQAILCINGNNSINNSFLTIYLAFYRNIIINTYLQGGQGNLSADIIKNLIINLPSIEDQTKIVQYINSIDKKLYTENEKLKNLNSFKKYLLQQMFI